MLHVHVFLVAPLGTRHVAKPRANQHQGGVAIGECPHHTGAPADLTIQPLDHVVGTDARPMLAGKFAVSQSFLNAVLDLFGGLLQLHSTQLGNNGFCFLAGRLFALLCVDRLEHFCHNFDLGFGPNGENIAVKVHGTTLVFGIGKHFSHGLQHPQALVADDELYAIQAAPTEPLEEADPAGLVLFHAFGGTQNLTKTILIYGNCHQNSHIFVLSASVAAQVDAVHVDIRIPSALQRAVAPVLDVDVGVLVQLADGGRRDLAAPQRLGDVLHTAHRNACQVHLDEGFLHAALPAAIPLDDGSFERYSLEPRHMERNVAGGRGKVAVIVAAAVALTGLAALVARRLRQQNSPSFSSSSFRVSSTLPRTNSLICPLIISSFSCTIFSDIVCCLLSNVCVVTSFYQSLQAMSSFLLFFNLRKLLYITP